MTIICYVVHAVKCDIVKQKRVILMKLLQHVTIRAEQIVLYFMLTHHSSRYLNIYSGRNCIYVLNKLLKYKQLSDNNTNIRTDKNVTYTSFIIESQ